MELRTKRAYKVKLNIYTILRGRHCPRSTLFTKQTLSQINLMHYPMHYMYMYVC